MSPESDNFESAPETPEAEGEVVSEVEQLKAQAAENWDKFLRVTADLENYRKRVIREREEVVRNARESVISSLLPALDNVERALEHSPKGTPLHDGLLQVQKQFSRSLGEFGLAEVTVKTGSDFDPNIHEAVSQVASDKYGEGKIIETLQSGYKLGERLLRPARVVVSKGSSAES